MINDFNSFNILNENKSKKAFDILVDNINNSDFIVSEYNLNLKKYWHILDKEEKRLIVNRIHEYLPPEDATPVIKHLVFKEDIECCFFELLEVAIDFKMLSVIRKLCSNVDSVKRLDRYIDNRGELPYDIIDVIVNHITYDEDIFLNKLLDLTNECSKKFHSEIVRLIVEYKEEEINTYLPHLHFYDKNVYNNFFEMYVLYNTTLSFVRKEVKTARYNTFIEQGTLEELITDLMYSNFNKEVTGSAHDINEIIKEIIDSKPFNISNNNFLILKDAIGYGWKKISSYIVNKYDDLIKNADKETLYELTEACISSNDEGALKYFLKYFKDNANALKKFYSEIINNSNFNLLNVLFDYSNAEKYIDNKQILIDLHKANKKELFEIFVKISDIDNMSFNNNILLKQSLNNTKDDMDIFMTFIYDKNMMLNPNNLEIFKEFLKRCYDNDLLKNFLHFTKLKFLMGNKYFVESIKSVFSDTNFFNKEFIGELFLKYPNVVELFLKYLSDEVQSNIIEYISDLIEKRHDVYNKLNEKHLKILAYLFEVDSDEEVKQILSAF